MTMTNNPRRSIVLRINPAWPSPEERQARVVLMAKMPELASVPLAVTVRTLADYQWDIELTRAHLLRMLGLGH